MELERLNQAIVIQNDIEYLKELNNELQQQNEIAISLIMVNKVNKSMLLPEDLVQNARKYIEQMVIEGIENLENKFDAL